MLKPFSRNLSVPAIASGVMHSDREVSHDLVPNPFSSTNRLLLSSCPLSLSSLGKLPRAKIPLPSDLPRKQWRHTNPLHHLPLLLLLLQLPSLLSLPLIRHLQRTPHPRPLLNRRDRQSRRRLCLPLDLNLSRRCMCPKRDRSRAMRGD